MLVWLVVHLLVYSSQNPGFPLLHIVSCPDPSSTCKRVRARDWSALIPDYMMDWLAEADKENDIATACQENQERGVVGVTVR